MDKKMKKQIKIMHFRLKRQDMRRQNKNIPQALSNIQNNNTSTLAPSQLGECLITSQPTGFQQKRHRRNTDDAILVNDY
jgi:hypothetical protein